LETGKLIDTSIADRMTKSSLEISTTPIPASRTEAQAALVCEAWAGMLNNPLRVGTLFNNVRCRPGKARSSRGRSCRSNDQNGRGRPGHFDSCGG
jgi:hypothetical protein